MCVVVVVAPAAAGSSCGEAVTPIHIHFVGILMIRLSDFLLCSLEQVPCRREKKEEKKRKKSLKMRAGSWFHNIKILSLGLFFQRYRGEQPTRRSHLQGETTVQV